MSQSLTTKPSPRFGATMGFHEGTKTALLFGGCGATTNQLVAVHHTEPRDHTHDQYIGWCSLPRGDTWAWSGTGWTQVAGGPTARYAASISYDYTAGALVLFGGGTWTVTTNANPTAPAGSQRCLHAIVDMQIRTGPATGKYLNFWCFKDTWYLKKVGLTWTWEQKTPAASPPARFDPFGASDGIGDPVIGLGCGKLGTMRHSDPDTEPSSYYFDCFHRNESTTQDTTGYYRDAWVWSHEQNRWNRRAPDSAADADCRIQNQVVPVCRRGIAGTHSDAVGGAFIFGGFFLEHLSGLDFQYNNQSFANDHVWQWDDAWLRTCLTGDTDCSLPSPSTTPGVRAFSSATTAFWDGEWRPVIFAGFGAKVSPTFESEHKNDLWGWQHQPGGIGVQNGTWIAVCATVNGATTCSTRPSPRMSSSIVYFPGTSGHILAFGGLSASGAILGDTWTFGAPSPLGAVPCLPCLSA